MLVATIYKIITTALIQILQYHRLGIVGAFISLLRLYYSTIAWRAIGELSLSHGERAEGLLNLPFARAARKTNCQNFPFALATRKENRSTLSTGPSTSRYQADRQLCWRSKLVIINAWNPQSRIPPRKREQTGNRTTR